MTKKTQKQKIFIKFITSIFIIVIFFGVKIEIIKALTISDNSKNIITLVSPIKDALTRITKKPFGIKVSPKNSPVQPERFSGYHTGVDFETTPAEANIDIPIYAVCSGKLIFKRWVSGDGGAIIQSCILNKQAYTVVYAHIKLSSVTLKIGDKIFAGDKIAVLGKGYSTETDGERKHLHLAISKGSKINLVGYVKTKIELNKWIDAQKYIN